MRCHPKNAFYDNCEDTPTLVPPPHPHSTTDSSVRLFATVPKSCKTRGRRLSHISSDMDYAFVLEWDIRNSSLHLRLFDIAQRHILHSPLSAPPSAPPAPPLPSGKWLRRFFPVFLGLSVFSHQTMGFGTVHLYLASPIDV